MEKMSIATRNKICLEKDKKNIFIGKVKKVIG